MPKRHIKKLRRLARRDDVDVWFEDECHFQQHGTRCTMWVPPEDVDPVVLHAPTRKSVAVFGAVRASDGYLVTSRGEKFNAETFETFLNKVVRHHRKGRRMVLIVDNAAWHHSDYLWDWRLVHRNVLNLDFLPPYSPDLNHIERVWKLTRRLCTHNQYFETLDMLICRVFPQFSAWAKPNEALRQLCAII